MPRFRKVALAILACLAVIAPSSLPLRAAEGMASPASAASAAVFLPKPSVAEPATADKATPTLVSPAATLDEPPSLTRTAGAFAGGLLMVVLAAFGLAITFRSLVKDVKGRKRRYRRRARSA